MDTQPITAEETATLDAVAMAKLRHDLRDPAGAVLGFAEMLLERLQTSGEPAAPSTIAPLRHIESAARHMLDILSETKRAARPSPHDDVIVPAAAAGSGTLLIIDDEREWRNMLATAFSLRGYRVIQAADGLDAERSVDEENIDVVLLDMSMPEIGGIEVLQRLRGRWNGAQLPVVVVTGQADERTIVAMLDRGANDYVTKGVTDLSVIVARVRTQVAAKRANDRIQELNAELRAAQEKIAGLADSSGQALQNIPSWAASMAAELMPSIRAGEIAVWMLEHGTLRPCTPTTSRPPSQIELAEAHRERRFLVTPEVTVVSVSGMTGRVSGGLMVWGKRTMWTDAERQLLGAFAFQLGGAIELQEVRSELEIARLKHDQAKQSIRNQGISVLRVCPLCERCFDETSTDCQFDATRLVTRPFPYIVADKFRMVRRIGRGGMGEVYQALDHALRRHVAVKVINPEYGGDVIRRRFEKEAATLAAIDSPHVVRIYDVGQLPGGSTYFVTEILRGSDVHHLVERHGPGRPDQVARLLRDASLGLAAVHARGIIHRDIKPGNIFLLDDDTQSFRAKVIDFGIAKNLAEESTTVSMIIGTPPYMSPEQLGAQTLSVKSDVYSLAAVIWETLSGKRLVASTEVWRIMYEVISRTKRPISSLVAGVGPDLDAALECALDIEPSRRPAVEEWGARVAALLDDVPCTVSGWPSPLPAAAIEDDGERTASEPTLHARPSPTATTEADRTQSIVERAS